MSEVFQSLLEKIEENKEGLTSAAYLSIVNHLKKVYETNGNDESDESDEDDEIDCYNKYIFELAVSGNVKGLQLYKECELPWRIPNAIQDSIYRYFYGYNLIDLVSKNGHVKVLEWWKNNGLEFRYTAFALDLASREGHVDVLEWWKNSGLELKYTKSALNYASEEGHVDVLEWWKNSGLEFPNPSNCC